MINNNCNYHMYDIELRIANRLHRKMSYNEYLNYLSKCYNCWFKQEVNHVRKIEGITLRLLEV